jgi:hypothetical protein
MRIKLTQESIDFAVNEGKEIFATSRRLKASDREQTKIDNCLRGAFGQQAFIDMTGGRRVTKQECPGFNYDVVCKNSAVKDLCGWKDDRPSGALARNEIKVNSCENRDWIVLNNEMFEHATMSAERRLLDYVVFYLISNVDLKKYEADIALLGVVAPKVLADKTKTFRRPSKFDKAESFLNKNQIHWNNLGIIFL